MVHQSLLAHKSLRTMRARKRLRRPLVHLPRVSHQIVRQPERLPADPALVHIPLTLLLLVLLLFLMHAPDVRPIAIVPREAGLTVGAFVWPLAGVGDVTVLAEALLGLEAFRAGGALELCGGHFVARDVLPERVLGDEEGGAFWAGQGLFLFVHELVVAQGVQEVEGSLALGALVRFGVLGESPLVLMETGVVGVVFVADFAHKGSLLVVGEAVGEVRQIGVDFELWGGLEALVAAAADFWFWALARSVFVLVVQRCSVPFGEHFAAELAAQTSRPVAVLRSDQFVALGAFLQAFLDLG